MASKNNDTSMTSRSSQDKGRSRSGQMFSTLEHSKRNPTNNQAAERRKSLVEQSEPKGVLGNMWNNFTKGTSAK